MPHQIKPSQQKHDQKVREIALQLRQADYFVMADLPDHKRPPTVGGVIPDIYAHKKGEKLVYEIETQQTLVADRPQREQLEKGARKIGAEFRVVLA